MASNAAAIKLTVAQRQALAALNQFQNKFASMTQSMSANSKKAANASSGMNKTLKGWGSNIRTAAMAMVGFGSATGAAYTVVGLVRKEIGVIEQTMNRMKDRQLDFGQSVRKLSFAMPEEDGNLVDMSLKDVVDRFKTGTTDPGQAIRLFHNIHSATADLPLSGKADIAEFLMKERFDLDEEGKLAAGKAIANLHAKQLARGFSSTPLGQMGLLEGAKAASMVVDDRAFYSNVAPMALDLARFGVNEGEALLLGSALTSSATDEEGTESRTALTKFFATLEEEKVKFGIEDEGMALLRGMREGKTDKHKAFSKHMLGVFSQKEDGSPEDFVGMTASEARLKIEGRSKMKFYLMDMIRAGTGEAESMLTIMEKIKGMGQIPLHYIGGTYQVAMQETFKQSEKLFHEQIAKGDAIDYVGLTKEQKDYDEINAALEMQNKHGARMILRKNAAQRLMENSGVPMSEFKGDIAWYMGKYGNEEGILKALDVARRDLIYRHPDKGQRSEAYYPGFLGLEQTVRSAELMGKIDPANMSIEDIEKLTYYTKGFFYSDQQAGVSVQQIEMIKAIDALREQIKEDRAEMRAERERDRVEATKVTKVQVTNVGAINEPTAAKKLGK